MSEKTKNQDAGLLDLFSGNGGLRATSTSDDLSLVDAKSGHYDNLLKKSETSNERRDQIYETHCDPYTLRSTLGHLVLPQENHYSLVEKCLDWIFLPKEAKPSGWEANDGLQGVPWQGDMTSERSSFFFHSNLECDREFKDLRRLRIYLLGKEIEPMIMEIFGINHTLSNLCFPPKIDYREMIALEKRRNGLIDGVISLLVQEGVFGAETVGLKVAIPAQEGVSSQGECPQSANDASPQGEAGGKASARVATQGRRKARGRCKHSFREAFIDVETYEREKDRLINFLLKLKIAARRLTCRARDYLNQIITCFMVLWREKGFFTEEPIPGACVFRFLTEECKIKTKVSEKAYGNRMNEWIKKNDYDIKLYRKVSEAFAYA